MELTPFDIEGPYYRKNPPERRNYRRDDEKQRVLILMGRVYDQNGEPVPNARIDFWHADENGDYDTESDEMLFYGQQTTTVGKTVEIEGEQVKLKSGLYRLNSIRPGQYLNGDQYRPAHIHAKVWIDGAVVLTTQLYFADDPYNENDPWFSDKLLMESFQELAEVLELRSTVESFKFDFVVQVG